MYHHTINMNTLIHNNYTNCFQSCIRSNHDTNWTEIIRREHINNFTCKFDTWSGQTHSPTSLQTEHSLFTHTGSETITQRYKNIHTHTHTVAYIHTHIQTHTVVQTHTQQVSHTLTHTHTHAHTHTVVHTHTHTQWHTHTHTHSGAHTHTHACMHVQFPLPAFAINICHTMFSQRIWNKWEFCTVRWEEEESSKQLDQNNTNYIPRCRIWKKWALPDKKRRKVPSSMTLSTLLSVVKDLEEVVRWWAGDRPKWRDPVIMIDSFQTGVTSIRWR